MTTLRVILDDPSAIAAPLGRYAEELVRQLIATAPRGSDVAGVVPASPESDYALIAERLPGLRRLYKSPLARRDLAAAWHHGFTRLPGAGMVHSTTLLAPLHRHDRVHSPGEQTVVTIHDAIAWTHPDLVPGRRGSWLRAMGKRTERYADAVVVPSHAVADDLASRLDLGDRVRVIGEGPTTGLAQTGLETDLATDLELPERYALTAAGNPRNGFDDLLAALSEGELADIHLVAVTDGSASAAVSALVTTAGLESRVRILEAPDPADLAAAFRGAAVFVDASRAAGPSSPMLDALAFGIPVIHSDVPALVELAAGAALIAPREDGEPYSDVLAAALVRLRDDPALAERLAIAGRDRARAFTWRDAAEKVWQLHADL